jgi:peroxiredoxin
MNFWYEGCAPCIAEMDALNKLYENNKENKNFQFISFCVDDIETIDKNKEKFNIEYTVIPIERSKAYVLNYQSGFPVTIIIDTEGKVVHYSSGGSIDKLKASEKVMNVYDKIIGKELLKEQ